MNEYVKVGLSSRDGNRYLYVDNKAIPIEDFKLEKADICTAKLTVTMLLDSAKTDMCSEIVEPVAGGGSQIAPLDIIRQSLDSVIGRHEVEAEAPH